MIRTAIVILNWNGRKFLERFLPILVDSINTEEHDQVIVADNASTDGSIELLKEKFPTVQTIELSQNFGFTGGYNRALAQIKAQYYVLINSDIEVSEGWLVPLLEWMEYHPECGICSPKLLSWYEKDRFEYAGAAGGYLDEFCYPFCRGRVMKMTEKDEGQYDEPAEVQWTTGACLMIRADLWHELKGLDERFFAHMEEIDLCWRAKLAGWKINVVPRSVVYHIGGGTLPNESEYKLFLNYRNNLMLIRNNYAKTAALHMFFNLASELEPIENYCSDPFFAAINVFQSAGSDMQSIWLAQSVKSAQLSAKILLNTRMVLDGLSAIVYLITGKWKYVRSVWRAHKEFRALRKEEPEQESVLLWLTKCVDDPKLRIAKTVLGWDAENLYQNVSNKNRFKIKGLYDSSIIYENLFHKKEIFETIHDSIF